MKTVTFIAVTLFAGAIAGTILGIINQIIVEPFIERAVALENQNAVKNGELINPIEFSAYRFWQKGGEIAAGTILGLSLGSLFGIVFAYTRDSIPGSSNAKKAFILAGVMWFTLFLVPALKYPAKPPAIGDPATIYYRQELYIAFLSISGFSTLGLALLYRKLGKIQTKKAIVLTAYTAIIVAAYLALPANADAVTAPIDLVIGFMLVSVFTISIFWGLLGITLGVLWDKLKPHETASADIVGFR